MSKKSAFTLAEILITLTIIGIVASLTIPSLLVNNQKQGFVAGLNKNYSVFSQAVQTLIAENGNMASSIALHGSMMNALKAKLNVAKYCAANTLPGECWHEGTTGWKDLHGDDGWTDLNTKDRMILSDGSMIGQGSSYNPNCTATFSGDSAPAAGNGCGYVFVDINGFKAPNQAGRDIFMFEITNVGAFVEGQYNSHGDPSVYSYDSWFFCNPAVSGSGNWPGCGCAARVLKEGAMNY